MSIRSVIEIRYAQIRSLDLSNGEGVGIALFVQGCHFHCPNCFNPETWDYNGGKEWTEEVKNKFLELANRPYIKRISILGGEPLAEENLDDVLDLVNRIRLSGSKKSIWLYTGYTMSTCKYFDDIIFTFHPSYYHSNSLNGKTIKVDDKAYFIKQDRKRVAIVKNIDVLIDGQYIDSLRDVTLPWCGSSNQKVIDIQQSLKKGEIVLWQT